MALVLRHPIDGEALIGFLRQSGQKIVGDMEMNLLAEEPLRNEVVMSVSTITTSATTAGASASDTTAATNKLTKQKAAR